MTKRSEVLNSLANTVLIVDANIADARKRRPDVDEDEGDLSSFQIVEESFFHAERDNGDAFNAALDHSANGKRDSLGIVDRGSGEDFIVVLNGDVFKPLDDFRKERISDLRNNQTKNTTAAGNERARLRVRIITEFFDYAPNAAGKLRRNGRNPIYSARNRCNGDFRSPCDFVNAQRCSPQKKMEGW